jgi:uncharacterized protein (UPF0303 family)
MLLSRHQTVGKNWDIKIANKSFENLFQFKYLGTTVTNQNLIQEEIKRRMKSSNAGYRSAFSSAFEERKNLNTQEYHFACGSVWI